MNYDDNYDDEPERLPRRNPKEPEREGEYYRPRDARHRASEYNSSRDGGARRRYESTYPRQSAYRSGSGSSYRSRSEGYDEGYDAAPRSTYRPERPRPAGRSRSSGRRRSHSGRNAVMVMLLAVVAVMIPFAAMNGLFSGVTSAGSVSDMLGAVPSPEVPFDDVFATPEATALPEFTALPTFAPTEAPTEVPGRVLDPNKKAIALTFDDGPSKYTREILAALAEVDGRATFFVVGERLDNYSETLQMEYDAGCQIGMHTYDHANLTKLSSSKILSEINSTNDLIYQYVGEYSTIVRPPYGSVNSTVKETVEQPLINWSLDTRDWESRDANSVYNEIMSNVEDGDIVLMHDLYSSTAEAVRMVLPRLVEQGYQLCTVEELFELKGIELHSGTVFRSAKPTSD
ncbi:MAG: polysaccharide deacetylase family protein [Candidatus Fimadaptatus sp.]